MTGAATSAAPPAESRQADRRPRGAVYAIAALVYAGHLAFGADRTNLALGLCTLWFAALALLLVSRRWARDALAQAPLGLIGAVFALLFAVLALALTPLGIGGPHPIWTFVPTAPAVVSIDPYATRIELVKLLGLAAAFLVGAVFGMEDERASLLLRALLLGGGLFCLWALFDHIASPTRLFGGPRPFDPQRLSAAFGSANTAATLCGAIAMLSIADVRRAYDRSRPSHGFRAFHVQRIATAVAPPALVLAFSLTALLLTASRAGIVATAGIAAVLLATLMLGRGSHKSIAAPIGASALVVAGFVVASLAVRAGAAGERFSSMGSATAARAEIFAAHLAAFKAAPWSGYGLGTFSHINAMVMNSANLPSLLYLGATHSVYIQWLEEAGVIGAGIMFGLVLIIAGKIVAGALQRTRARTWLAAILAVLALFALHGLSDYALQVPSMAIFLSLLLGVGVGLASPRGPQPTASKRAWASRQTLHQAAGAASTERPTHA